MDKARISTHEYHVSDLHPCRIDPSAHSTERAPRGGRGRDVGPVNAGHQDAQTRNPPRTTNSSPCTSFTARVTSLTPSIHLSSLSQACPSPKFLLCRRLSLTNGNAACMRCAGRCLGRAWQLDGLESRGDARLERSEKLCRRKKVRKRVGDGETGRGSGCLSLWPTFCHWTV